MRSNPKIRARKFCVEVNSPIGIWWSRDENRWFSIHDEEQPRGLRISACYISGVARLFRMLRRLDRALPHGSIVKVHEFLPRRRVANLVYRTRVGFDRD